MGRGKLVLSVQVGLMSEDTFADELPFLLESTKFEDQHHAGCAMPWLIESKNLRRVSEIHSPKQCMSECHSSVNEKHKKNTASQTLALYVHGKAPRAPEMLLGRKLKSSTVSARIFLFSRL